MTAAVLLSAYHKGRFQFRVCRVNGTSPQEEREQLTDACLDQHILVSAGRPRWQANHAEWSTSVARFQVRCTSTARSAVAPGRHARGRTPKDQHLRVRP